MSTLRTPVIATSLILIGMLTLSACASGPGSVSPRDVSEPTGLAEATPAPPDGEVVGVGMVLGDQSGARFCLGAVMESHPPQCAGLVLTDWSWEGVDGSESTGSTRWGSYALTGSFDGSHFTVTKEPIPLALYDPLALPDPTQGRDGVTSEERLHTIQDRIAELLDAEATHLGATVERGRVWVDVVWDDGTLQRAADSDFGEDVVVIRSALRAVNG